MIRYIIFNSLKNEIIIKFNKTEQYKIRKIR